MAANVAAMRPPAPAGAGQKSLRNVGFGRQTVRAYKSRQPQRHPEKSRLVRRFASDFLREATHRVLMERAQFRESLFCHSMRDLIEQWIRWLRRLARPWRSDGIGLERADFGAEVSAEFGDPVTEYTNLVAQSVFGIRDLFQYLARAFLLQVRADSFEGAVVGRVLLQTPIVQ